MEGPFAKEPHVTHTAPYRGGMCFRILRMWSSPSKDFRSPPVLICTCTYGHTHGEPQQAHSRQHSVQHSRRS
jgi:hypothetical protein